MEKLNKEEEGTTKKDEIGTAKLATAEELDDPNNEVDEGVELDKMDVEADLRTPLTDDHSMVKILPSASVNGEAKGSGKPIVTCLTKDELGRYAVDPFWIKVRWILFIFFWLIWVVMLVLAIVVVILAPKCPAPADREWWQAGPIYQIYVRSFKDTDGNGNGDIKGIVNKLDYIQDYLGVQTLLLSPVYESPFLDDGYSNEDLQSIADIYGKMECFESLVAAMEKRDMKLVLDFIPNHTSMKHPWFVKSEKGEEKYKDYYVWTEAKNKKPVYNWLSVYNGSAWEYSRQRDQCYLHQFKKDQPDLNLRNEDVKDELKDVLRFWLDKGVHGFRMLSVGHLYENLEIRNEQKSEIAGAKSNEYQYLAHDATLHQPENMELLAEFREVLDNYTSQDDVTRVLIVDAGKDISSAWEYYGNSSEALAHFPLNYGFITLSDEETLTGQALHDAVEGWINNTENYNQWPNWMLSNNDVSRSATRYGNELIDILNVITVLLPGTPITYYGEEIGMIDGNMVISEKNRANTPMQWNNKSFADFTNGSDPWVLVNSDYEIVNVEAQKKEHNSHLDIYRKLVQIRKKKAAQFGEINYPIVNDTIFSFTRITKGAPGLCVAVNLGNSTETIDISGAEKVPATLTLELPIKAGSHREQLDSSKISIPAKKAVVLSFVPASG